jgi:hypothetical protein
MVGTSMFWGKRISLYPRDPNGPRYPSWRERERERERTHVENTLMVRLLVESLRVSILFRYPVNGMTRHVCFSLYSPRTPMSGHSLLGCLFLFLPLTHSGIPEAGRDGVWISRPDNCRSDISCQHGVVLDFAYIMLGNQRYMYLGPYPCPFQA